MKQLVLLLSAGLMAVSCVFHFGDGTYVGHCTEEGIDYSEIREVGPFNALTSSLPCKVYYVQADEQKVEVESTEEQAGKVLTKVENGTLHLKLAPGRYPTLILRVTISSPDIERIQISGSGNLISRGVLHAGDDLDLKVSGSGSIFSEEIDCKDLTAHCSGSGSLRFDKASCSGFFASVSGSGAIIAQTVLADGNASARVSGSGRIRLGFVDINGDMDLKTSGSGGITINGSCHEVVATTNGSGSISGDLTHTGIRTHRSGSGHVNL